MTLAIELPAGGPAARTDLVALRRRIIRPNAWILPAVDGAALAAAVTVAAVPWPVAVVYVATALVILRTAGQHRLRICLRLGDEIPRLVGSAVGPVLLLALLHLPILPLAPVAAGLLVAGRAGCYQLLRMGRRRGVVGETALVVGADPLGVGVAEALTRHPELGLSLVGFLDARAPSVRGSATLVGDVLALSEVVAEFGIRRVIVSHPDVPDALLVRLLRGLPADVCVVPRLHAVGMRAPLSCLDEIWGIPLVPLRRPSRAGRTAKRAFDLVVGSILLVGLAPALLGLGLAVRLGSAMPALFRQRRVTAAGRAITVLKLRTLADQPDSDTRWVVERGSYLRFGAFLRTTHLDELPQLVNVVRGDMSLVGPRPERPFFNDLFGERIPDYDGRYRMRAGMTGWAQVHGMRGDTSIEERIRFDNQYIEYWSPWRDLVILFRTLATVRPERGGRR